MDIFAHTLWTNALFHLKYHNQRRLRYLAAFFGVMPDLIGFTPLFVYLVLSGSIFHGGKSFLIGSNWTYAFAENAYNYTHSLVVFSFFFLLVLVIGNIYLNYKKRPLYMHWFPWPMLGWALHIFIDIPTHPNIYHTPVFFPLSGWEYTHGVAWSHPLFMAINYSVLGLVYVGLYYYQRREHDKKVSKRTK